MFWHFFYFRQSAKKIYALYAMPIKDLLSSNHVTINHAGMYGKIYTCMLLMSIEM